MINRQFSRFRLNFLPMVRRSTYEEKLGQFGLDEDAAVETVLDKETRQRLFDEHRIISKFIANNVEWNVAIYHEQDDGVDFLTVEIDFLRPVSEDVRSVEACFAISLEIEESPETAFITRHRFVEYYDWNVYSDEWVVYMMRTDLYQNLGDKNLTVKVIPTEVMMDDKFCYDTVQLDLPCRFYDAGCHFSNVYRKIGTEINKTTNKEELDHQSLKNEKTPQPIKRRKRKAETNLNDAFIDESDHNLERSRESTIVDYYPDRSAENYQSSQPSSNKGVTFSGTIKRVKYFINNLTGSRQIPKATEIQILVQSKFVKVCSNPEAILRMVLKKFVNVRLYTQLSFSYLNQDFEFWIRDMTVRDQEWSHNVACVTDPDLKLHWRKGKKVKRMSSELKNVTNKS